MKYIFSDFTTFFSHSWHYNYEIHTRRMFRKRRLIRDAMQNFEKIKERAKAFLKQEGNGPIYLRLGRSSVKSSTKIFLSVNIEKFFG